MLKEFISEEEGQDLVEYALLLSFIALVASIALPALGQWLSWAFFTATHPFVSPWGYQTHSQYSPIQFTSPLFTTYNY